MTVDSVNYVTGEDKTFKVTDPGGEWQKGKHTPKVVFSLNKLDRVFEINGAVIDSDTFEFKITAADGKAYLTESGRFFARIFKEDCISLDRAHRGELNLFTDGGPGAA